MTDLPIVVHLPHTTRQALVRELERIVKRVRLDSEYRDTFISIQERLQVPCTHIALLLHMEVTCFSIAVGNINTMAYRLKAPNRKLFKAMAVALTHRM